MKHQSDIFKKANYIMKKSWGRSSSDRQVRWFRDESVESNVSVAPAPGTAIKTTVILMNQQPSMNDESIVEMDSAVPSVEINPNSLLRVKRRKRDEMNIRPFWTRSLKDVPPWIYRDENNNIIMNFDLSKREIYVRTVIQLMSDFIDYLPSIYSAFSINQNISSKFSGFINYFKIPEDAFGSQRGFAVIELKVGPPILIGPFKPVNLSKKEHLPDSDHTEEQCIREVKEEIKGKEKLIKAIFIFTKKSPCLSRKGRDSCTIQLIRFSEEMNSYSIKVYIGFQDFYGASGNIVNELKGLINDEDNKIKNTLLGLKKKVNKKHRRSKFPCLQGNKRHKRTSKDIKDHINKRLLELGCKDVSLILKYIVIEFPSNELTLDEFENFGKQQADKLKILLKNPETSKYLNVSNEIIEEVSSLFHSQWCELMYEKYEDFIFKKVSDEINTFAVNFAHGNIKSITKYFHMERVKFNF